MPNSTKSKAKPKSSKPKNSIFGWILSALAVLLSITALLSAAARWFIYDIEQYRGTIVSQISDTFGLDVSISEIEGRVDLINPIIYAQQVELSNPEISTPPLIVGQMEVVMDLLSSLINAEPRFRSLQMSGIELAVSTDMENKLIRLPQIDREFSIPKRQFNLDELLSKAATIDYFDIGFHDVLINWHHKGSENTQSFNIKNFILNPLYYKTQLALVAELPKTLGLKLTFIAELEHDIFNPGGDFYINVEDLNLATVSQLSDLQPTQQGLLRTELWGQASYQQGLENLTGILSLKDYLNPELDPAYAISHLQTVLNWQTGEGGRELNFTGLSAQGDDAILEDADLAIVQTQDEAGYFSNLRFQANHISPSIYNRLLSHAQSELVIEQNRIPTADDKQTVDLILYTAHSDRWFISPRAWPPIRLSEPTVSADLPELLGGQFELILDDIRLRRGQWTLPQNLEQVELKGNYKQDSEYAEWNLENLYIKGSADSNLTGNISYRISDGKDKRLQSSLRLNNLKATEIAQWIPPQTLKPKLENWLGNAIRGGTVQYAELSVNGNPDFPFGKDAGLWRLEAQADDVTLAYRKKDPEITELALDLSLENKALKIRSNNLRMMDFYSKDTTVLLEDIAVPYIKIETQGRGPLADVLSYAKMTGLADPESILISNIETDGDVDMSLKVHTRMVPTLERETHIGGYIDLDGANMKLKTLGLDFNQLEGRLYFDRLGGRSDNIKASLNDTYPLTASAESRAGSTLLKMQTRIPFPSNYLRIRSLPENTLNTALDTWNAELLIPPLRANSEGILRLKLNSDLKALAVNMPEPLYKPAGEAANSTFLAEVSKTSSNYRFDYSDRMRLTLQNPNTETDIRTPTGLLHFSPEIAYPFEAGGNARFMVRGVIPHFSINEWLDWKESYEDGDADSELYAEDIDVLIDKLVWNTSTANQAHLSIKQQQDKTLVAIDSEMIKGNASIPADQNQRVYIDLDHLMLRGGALSSDSHKLDPTTLPPTSIKIDRFKSTRFDIEDVKVALSPNTDGLQITRMTFSKKDGDKILIQAQLQGDWKKINEQDYSDFNFQLSSEDYGQLLRNWNFFSGLRGGQGQINGQLNWDHSPMEFELDQLQGPVKLQIEDGSMETIEPGVGRLFGLLNVNVLARRLSLDFKDVFDKGFEFDTIQGALEFDKTNLMTQNLNINGPALDMKIAGRTGISQRDYDQKIMVTPHVGSNVALATAFLGGPLTAATVFLLGKVTELDDWVDEIITLEYTLKGTWDKPEVEFISAPVAKKLDPMNTLKTPSRHIKGVLDKIFSRKDK